MFITFFVNPVIFVLFLISCKAVNNEQKDLELILQKSFEQIYLAKFGLAFPTTEYILNRCIQYNDKQCLETYNDVMEGKKTIQSVSSAHALETTLDMIEKACVSIDKKLELADELLVNQTCYGGIISLYFYNSPEQDAKILERIKIYPKQIKKLIFDSEFHWFYNRPNKDAWVNAVSTMDVNWENNNQKQYVLNLFRKSIEDVKDDTWVLK